MGIMNDPKYWDGNCDFNPDRWLKKSDRDAFAYIPFNAGPRNCKTNTINKIYIYINIIDNRILGSILLFCYKYFFFCKQASVNIWQWLKSSSLPSLYWINIE